MLAVIAALLLQAAAVTVPPPATAASSDVVVSAQGLDGTAAALAACLARRCSPIADINATIAHADNQFVAGDFAGARKTLIAARGRNQRHASDYPIAVSELLRVDAFVAQLVGETAYARIGTIDSLAALKAGLAPDDQRIAAQRLEIAGIFARQGRQRTAIAMLDSVADRAGERGWTKLEAEARLRAAALYAAIAMRDQAVLQETHRRLDQLHGLTAADARPYVDAALLIEARVAQVEGNEEALAMARAKARTARVDRAILVYVPPVDLRTALVYGDVKPIYDVHDQWIDVRFNVAPDGSVRNVAEIGRGRRAEGRWMKVAREAVAGRQYLPLAQDANGPGIERIERFMLTASLARSITSRIRLPVEAPKMLSVDLTPRDLEPGTVLPTAG